MRGESVQNNDFITNIGPVFFPSFDLIETSDKYTLVADLPGLSLGDLDIALSADTITITGERAGENLREAVSCHALERTFGTFLRTFRLPGGLDPDRLLALMDNGVLTVDVPKQPLQLPPSKPSGSASPLARQRRADLMELLSSKSDH